jgi:DnaJ-class molecular chaperone
VRNRETRLNFPGKGIENVKTGKSGGLSVRFKIVIPEFSDRQMDMWEEFFKRENL